MLNKLRQLLSRPAIEQSDGNLIHDITYRGHIVRLVDPAAGTDQIIAQLADGTFERPMPDVFSALVEREGGLVLDVGANNGIYSILACLAHPHVKVEAFEPFPPVLDVLKRNIALNGIARRVRIRVGALSDHNGTTALYIPDVNHGLLDTSCSLRHDFQPSSRSIQVEVCRLDDIKLPTRPTILKVDIEGHEAAFLEGARATIERYRPYIFCEILHLAEFERLERFRRAVGYTDIRLRLDAALIASRIAFDEAAWNHLLLPPERAANFLAIWDRLAS